MIGLIAETAWHHEGDFEFMQDLVHRICTESAADVVKMHITIDFDEYMSPDHEAYQLLASWMLSPDQWEELIKIVRKSGKKLMLLLNDTKAVEFAARFAPEFVELHSVCLNVPRLQKAVKEQIKPDTKIVIGVGGCTIKEIDDAVRAFEDREVILMFGFQNYPTKYEDVNLAKIQKIQSLYKNKQFGYADHTGWDEVENELITLMVSANGMSYIEKHVTTNYGVKRCDFSAAISIEMFNHLAAKVKLLHKLYGDGSLGLNAGEKAYSIYGPMKMAPQLVSEMQPGDALSEHHFEFRRTKQISNISQSDVADYIGKKIRNGLAPGHVLRAEDFE